MTTKPPSLCDSCLHRITGNACEAFDEIPYRFLLLEEPHTSPTEDQANKVVWEMAPGTELEYAEWVATQDLVEHPELISQDEVELP